MKNTKNGKNLSKALLMGTALVSLSSYEANAATFTSAGSMSAVILAPIAVANPTGLSFGTFTEAGGGTLEVEIDTLNQTNVLAGTINEVTASSPTTGILTVTAAAGAAMDINIAAATYTMNDGGGNTMTVQNFDIISNGNGPTGVITAAGTPTATVTVPVGAELVVPALQTPGAYTGFFDVVIDYQ